MAKRAQALREGFTDRARPGYEPAMTFLQEAPELPHPFHADGLLREYVARRFQGPERAKVEAELVELGTLASGPLYRAQLEDRLNDPELVSWDPWGRRIDQIRITRVWEEAERLTAKHGLVATAYEGEYGDQSRVFMFLKNFVVQASLDVYSCPLAMTDGAARTLLEHENRALIDRALPRLTSRDPSTAWTSGQWMTERTGGSDVGLSETVAKQVDGVWRLYGVKWFTSATTAQMALTLARPEGNGPGGRGLALFYLETRDEHGVPNQVTLHRLKDKLGTRKVPTAELTLDGTIATPVVGLGDGVRNITPMLNVTRTWNAVASAWGMRRGLHLAKDYARRRFAFGATLSDKPLHADTLAGLEAEAEGAFLLSFRAAELLGKLEAKTATESELALLRVMTPIVKLTTGKQAVEIASEVLESFGGAGYVEDTGLPRLLADAQVLPIWEGTTNVLSLDTLRALAKGDAAAALTEEVKRLRSAVSHPELGTLADAAMKAFGAAQAWLVSKQGEPERLEAGARRFAITLGRALELLYLTEHAQAMQGGPSAARAAYAARRFAGHGVTRLADYEPTESRTLASL